jgi:hypothetical protein
VGRLGRAAEENLEIAQELLALTRAANIILEIEIGVVGGEEDGVANEINDKLYTTIEDGLATAAALGLGENGRYMAGADLRQRARRLQAGQRQAAPRGAVLKEIIRTPSARSTADKPFDLVFHGGSGSLPQEISEAVDYGVVKMNVDTDTQYAFTRPVADWMLKQLRRRPEDRRRGRQQEAVRPPRLGQGGRGRHGRPRRRGLPEPPLRRHPRSCRLARPGSYPLEPRAEPRLSPGAGRARQSRRGDRGRGRAGPVHRVPARLLRRCGP